MTGIEAGVSFVANAIKLLPAALSAAKAVAKGKDFVEFEFEEAHIAYCTTILKNYCKARTFFVRDEPQYLEEFYVPTSLIRGPRRRERIESANLESLRKISPHIIVDGSGGSGKTVFMRYLMLDSIERGVAYPVLFELRLLNDEPETPLEDMILAHMVKNGFPLGVDYAKKALKLGQLVLLLDGLDEVNFSRRKRLANEIRRIAVSTDNHIIVSSRPDLTLEGWDQFSRVQMAPLQLDEACQLVEKIKFDDDDGVKARFIASLKNGLFATHHSFLSNPLLLSIMLLTYGHSADIPKRFSSFYERAYIALFEKHDAYKGYRRQRETDLDISEFSSLFAAFCIVTLNDGIFRFAPTDAMRYVKVAKKLSSARDIPENGFIEDAKQAVCLLVEEGLDLSFVHRSFQEYFAAKYIQNADRGVQEALVKRYGSSDSRRFVVDNVLRYLYELAPSIVEEFYLIPALKKVFGKGYKRKLSYSKWKGIFLSVIGELHQDSDDRSIRFVIAPSKKATETLNLMAFVREVCLEEYCGRMRSLWDATGGALAAYATAGETTEFSSFAASSPVWRIIADSKGFYSIDDLDLLRGELVEMEKRIASKQEAELAFLVESSRR